MDISQDAGLFVHQLDVANDNVLVVKCDENALQAASFLDNRFVQPMQGQQQKPMQWIGWDQIAPLPANARDDAQFIFHIGHVGSTLISRLLGEASDTISLREPLLLRQFAELKALKGKRHCPWPPELFERRLEQITQWLSRCFRNEQRSLVKATSFASDLAPEFLHSSRKSLFLTLKPERYLQTILAGENSRKELAALSGTRLQRLNRKIEGEGFNLWELDEAQSAAMAWVCEMVSLEQANNANVLWLDFDAFLDAPAAMLNNSAQHLQVRLSQEDCEKLTSGPIMTRYSKAPEHAYSTQLREDVLAQAAKDFASPIKSALQWLEHVGAQHPEIAAVLSRV